MNNLPVAWVLSLAALAAPIVPAQDRKPLTDRSGLQVVEADAEDMDLRVTPVVRAVQKAADSVVSIYIAQKQALANGGAIDGQGSGVILDPAGFVITNWHVVATALGDANAVVQVKLRDGRSFGARILSSSPQHDLALLQLQMGAGDTVKPIEIGRSQDLMVGETLIAIGNPQGHSNTVTSGVLSATGRSIRVRTPDGRAREYSGLLQTDAAINQGNSGGALLDITGKLIGVNNAMAVGAENIGFAIPVDTVRDVFEKELIASDSFAQALDSPWLGIELDEREGALVVREVSAGSPADRAGIRKGDVLAGIGADQVASRVDYLRRLLGAQLDKPLQLRLQRGSRTVELEARLGTRAAHVVATATGLVLEEVGGDQDPELLRQATLTFYRAAGARRVRLLPVALRVLEVQPESSAAELGIQQGDVLIALQGRSGWGNRMDIRLDSLSDLAQKLQQLGGQQVGVVVLRDGKDLEGPLDVRTLQGR